MAKRIVLNETSYHGKGAVREIAAEVGARGFKKAFICSDPDLVKFGVTKKVTDVLDEAGCEYEVTPTLNQILRSKTFRQVWLHLRSQVQII